MASIALIGKLGDVQIGDQDRMQMHGFEILNHLVEVRKLLRIHGEWAILQLIVDVEDKSRPRECACSAAQPVGNAPHLGLGRVAIARLLESPASTGEAAVSYQVIHAHSSTASLGVGP